MLRKLTAINLFLSLTFLFTAIFSPPLFSYETTDYHSHEEDWVDESLSYKSVTYEKVRCPRCGMEFYYVPGKEGPHAQWVHYAISKEELKDFASEFEEEIKENEIEKTEGLKGLFDLFMHKKDEMGKSGKGLKADAPKQTIKRRDPSASGPKGLQAKFYELRQKLTCPYDGYSFFSSGKIIEEARMMQGFLSLEEPSMIEKSFGGSISLGVSENLRQFGYDLFMLHEESEKKEKSATPKTPAGTLAAFGLLQSAFDSPSSSLSFSPSSTGHSTMVIPVGPDYIIGPGDVLVINIWGSVQESFPIQVDGEGKIILPKAGPLYLWGLSFQEAEKRITQRLNQFYTNFNVDVSMGKLREIQVYVMGEVKKPGSYSMSSRSTIFQALHKAGGPSKLGSLRKIKLIRNDGKEEKIDLYSFLLKGENIRHSRILSGDTIFVPPIGDVVAIAGNVKRPAIYETKSEIPLSDLLSFAGGITPTGDLQRIQVERVRNNERRVMFDIELKRTDIGKFSLKNISMRNGDTVIVSPIVRLKHDFVSILGNVERPGDYALSKDMGVRELIKRAKGFLPGTYLYRAEIARVSKDRSRQVIPIDLNKLIMEEDEHVLLDEWDILLIYSEAEVRPPSFVEIDGAVNRPGKYELTPGMKISDLVFKAGGVRSDKVIKEAELFHIMPGEQPVVRDLSIRKISDTNISIDKDIILRAGDALFIKSELKLTERRIVTIKGEVKYPGVYSVREGERISSLIERAGGLTKEAFLDGAVFTRKSIKEIQEKMRQRYMERENRALLEEQQSILLRSSNTSVSSVSESLKIRAEMLDFITSAEIEGRMVVNLKPISQMKGTKNDILLEDGDSLTIPLPNIVITVMGSVNNPASVPFEEKKGIDYYIRRAGGVTRHAHKSGTYIVRANGEALSKFMMSKKVQQGDTIVVPQKFKYWTPPGQILKDTVEIFSRIVVGIGIIAALD